MVVFTGRCRSARLAPVLLNTSALAYIRAARTRFAKKAVMPRRQLGNEKSGRGIWISQPGSRTLRVTLDAHPAAIFLRSSMDEGGLSAQSGLNARPAILRT